VWDRRRRDGVKAGPVRAVHSGEPASPSAMECGGGVHTNSEVRGTSPFSSNVLLRDGISYIPTTKFLVCVPATTFTPRTNWQLGGWW